MAISCVPEEVESERLVLDDGDLIGEWRALEGGGEFSLKEDGTFASVPAICGLLVEGLNGKGGGEGGGDHPAGVWKIEAMNEMKNDSVSLRFSGNFCAEGAPLVGMSARENDGAIELYVWEDGEISRDRIFVRSESAEH